MLRVVAILVYFLACLPVNAQMLLRGAGPGSAGGCSGASCITFTATGPSTGTTGSPSTNFTVTLGTGSFSGAQTITIADGAQGGTFTPSVGSPGTSTVVVTPAALATSFTFTYNAASNGAKALTFTNAQGWTNAPSLTYTASGGVAYTGPGDVIASAASWYGTRAYSAAYAVAGSNALNVRNTVTNETCDVPVVAAGGLGTVRTCSGSSNGLTLAAFCALSSGTCAVTRAYDQAGGGHDVTQATAANQPILTLSCQNALPCMTVTGTQSLTNASYTFNFPWTWSAVTRFTTSNALNGVMGFVGAGSLLFFDSTPTLKFNNSGGLSINTAINTWYATGLTGATNSGILYVNALTPNSSAVSPPNESGIFGIFTRGNCCTMAAGDITEIGLWPTAANATQVNNLIANQRAYWNF